MESRDGQVESIKGQADSGLPFSSAVGCLISLLIGLAVVGVVYLVLSLASGREIHARVGEFNEVRLWLVREDQNTGFGISSSSLADLQTQAAGPCVVTSVRFLLWRDDGSAQNIRYCECYQRVGDTWQARGACGP